MPVIARDECPVHGLDYGNPKIEDGGYRMCARQRCPHALRRVEYVPASQLAGAVSRETVDAALAAWDAFRADNNLDGTLGFEQACDALNALRGQ